jgi:hypothetical protein
MDFVWIANDQGDITGVTATSPLTGGGTSGAITVGILSGTTSNLGAVQLSTSTSSTSTSLAATASAVKEAYDLANRPNPSNPVINSAFNVWQRGTTFSAQGGVGAPAYTADRYQFYRGGGVTGATMSRVVTGDTTNLPFIQYAARAQRDSGNTSTQNIRVIQTIESVNSIPFAGKTVTFSFYARAGANYSSTSSLLNANLYSGTGTDQNALTGFTGSVDVVNQNATLTTTWQRFTYTGNVASTATELGISFINTPVGTAGANDYFDVTGVQIDVGSVALPFRTAGVTYQEELAMCQRYYYRNTATGDVYTPFNYGAATSTARTDHYFQFPVTMRTRPTSVGGANLQVIDLTGNNFAITSLTINLYNAAGANVYTGGATGMTQFRPMMITANNNTSAYIEFNAEL